MTTSILPSKRPLLWRTVADLLTRLWQRHTPAPAPLGAPADLGNHLLRDIHAPGRIHGQALEHSELARYDRQQALRARYRKI